MKRFVVLAVATLVVVGMLVVVAPASAATLSGVITGGTGVNSQTGDWTFATHGAVNLVTGAKQPVNGAVHISTRVPPFPNTVALGRTFGPWGPASTVDGNYVTTSSLSVGDTTWTGTLTMPSTRGGTFTLDYVIINSPTNWLSWHFEGVVVSVAP